MYVNSGIVIEEMFGIAYFFCVVNPRLAHDMKFTEQRGGNLVYFTVRGSEFLPGKSYFSEQLPGGCSAFLFAPGVSLPGGG